MTLKLFILEPDVVFQGRVNEVGGITFPVDEFDYDGVTQGTFGLVYLNQTILFGSTQGGDDLGRSRVRKSPTSSIMYIGRSSQGDRDGEVNIVDNSWFTVVDLFQVWSKTPFISGAGTTFMDSDLTYATNGADSPPVANGGAAVAATVSGGVITVDFSATNSFTTEPGATISTYGWDVQDGTITVGTSASSTITATFPAGFRYVTLTITDSNAKIHQTHIPVLALAGDNTDTVNNFTIENHRITKDGQELSVRVRQDIDEATYLDGTMIMLIDGEPASASDRTNVLFMGFIQSEPATIQMTETGLVRDVVLNCVDVAGRMKELPGFPMILEDSDAPTTWQQMTDPNMDRYLHYLLQWQSTALDLADFTWSATTTSYLFKVLASEGASLWDQVNRRANALVPDYHLTCNTLGQLKVIVDPMLQATADRTSTVQVTLDSGDYYDIQLVHQRHPRIHWLRSNAIRADATAVNSLFCVAPGEAPGQGEGHRDHGEQLAISQGDLNTVTGNRYARLNARQGLFRIILSQGDRQGIEPANLTWVNLTIEATQATRRGLSFTNERGLVTEIDIRYSHERTGTVKTVSLLWERETSGPAAVTVVPAVAEQVDTTDPLTPISPTQPPDFDQGIASGINNIALISDNGLIYRTSDFLAGSPTWTLESNQSSDFGGGINLWSFVVDPFSPLYRTGSGAVNAFVATGSGIWKLNNIFGTASATLLHTFATPVTATQGRWRTIAASFGRFQATESDNPWIMVATNYGNPASGNKGVWIIYSTDGGQSWNTEAAITSFRDTVNYSSFKNNTPGLWLSPRTPGYGITFAWTESEDFADSIGYKTEDWGATWTQLTVPDSSQALGGSLHIPWASNTDEEVMYHGRSQMGPTLHTYQTIRVDSPASDTNISPGSGFQTYGPRRGLFGIRTYDGDRKYVAMVGFKNGLTTDQEDDYSGVFVSSTYGNAWTQIVSDTLADVGTKFPTEVAFSGDDPDFLYIWGDKWYIRYTDDFGATIKDPTGNLNPASGTRIVGLVGGIT